MIKKDKFGNKINNKTFAEMLISAKKLRGLGYSESFKKPNLFYKKFEGGVFFADMRGTKEIPIWEDSSPLYYWIFNNDVPFWKRRRFIEQEFNNLAKNGCFCRVSFEVHSSPELLMENSTKSQFIDWSEGYFEWEDGFCKTCKQDMMSDGWFCSKECKKKYKLE